MTKKNEKGRIVFKFRSFFNGNHLKTIVFENHSFQKQPFLKVSCFVNDH